MFVSSAALVVMFRGFAPTLSFVNRNSHSQSSLLFPVSSAHLTIDPHRDQKYQEAANHMN